ncbi:hypothetical protein ACFXAW_30285 [Streptomyces sp. NPDC059445]|uniref:hypothetical protein n=1 Tax=Streptomyces sp. NPDC059445 TaxID=3346832 RepID=UPI00369D7751
MQEIDVTADSVNRYRRDTRKHPPADVAAKIDDAVKQQWQPLAHKRRHRHARANDLTIQDHGGCEVGHVV